MHGRKAVRVVICLAKSVGGILLARLHPFLPPWTVIQISAVVDKHFVDKTAILRKYHVSTKILFCWHNNLLFLKHKGHMYI